MKTRTQTSIRTMSLAIGLTLMLVGALVPAAWADGAAVDGDTLNASSEDISVSGASCGSPVTKAGALWIVRNNGSGTFANGEALTVTRTITNNSAGKISSAVTSSVATVPNDWSDIPTTGSDPRRNHKIADISTTVAADAGNGTYEVKYRVVGNASNTMKDDTFTVTVNCVSAVYTTSIQRPVTPSTSTSEQLNKIKNGRVVPIKGEVMLGTTVVTDLNKDATTLFQIKVSGAKCTSTDEAPTLVTEFADAGESSAGTQNFRYEDGFWTYNLDTKALGLETGKCYKVEMMSKAGTAGAVAMTNQWVILEVVR